MNYVTITNYVAMFSWVKLSHTIILSKECLWLCLLKALFTEISLMIFLHFQSAVLSHYIFTISQLWLTSHPRNTVVLLDTGTPGTNRNLQ